MERYMSLADEVIKWVPPERKPIITREWVAALEETLLLFQGRVVLTWDVDAWRVTSAIQPCGISPSGTLGKPQDCRDALVQALHAKGLPVKAG